MGKHTRKGAGGRRPGSGRPPTRDPVAYLAYLRRRNATLQRELTDARHELAEARRELATPPPVPLIPADERARRLDAWFARRASRRDRPPGRTPAMQPSRHDEGRPGNPENQPDAKYAAR